MKVLFVITNIDGFYSDTFSIGLASLMSYVAAKGHEYDVAIVNTRDDYKNVINTIKRMETGVIGYTSVSSQFMYVKELSQVVRKECGESIIQVCGGIHPTIYPGAILEADALDGIFVGEGEYPFSEFLERVEKDLPYNDVKNFAYNDNDTLIKNDLYPLISNLDELPFPERDKYSFATKFLDRDKGLAVFWFTRGCPFHCTYCSNHAIANTYDMKVMKPRFRSPDSCMEELKLVIGKYDVRLVEIGDDTFGLSKKWAEEFCEKYASQINVPFRAKLRCNLVTRELMEMLKEAGCIHIYSAIESGNDYIRNEVLKRNMSKEQIINAYSLYKEYNMASGACFMIGVPQETEDTIWETININKIIKPSNSRANIFYPYKGTVLGDYCFKEGLVDEDAFNNFSRERQGSVLKFSPEFRDRLTYYHKNWRVLSKTFGKTRLFIHSNFPKTGEAIRLAKHYSTRLVKGDFS